MGDRILKTVSKPSKQAHCVRDESTLNGSIWHKNLEQACSIPKTDTLRKAREQYELAVKPIQTIPRPWDAWVQTWELAMEVGKQKGLANTQNADEWMIDLAEALRGIEVLSTNVQVLTQIQRKEIDDGTLKPRDIANEMRQWGM